MLYLKAVQRVHPQYFLLDYHISAIAYLTTVGYSSKVIVCTTPQLTAIEKLATKANTLVSVALCSESEKQSQIKKKKRKINI